MHHGIQKRRGSGPRLSPAIPAISLNETAEAISNPLPTPSLTSAFGLRTVEGTYLGFSYGRLADGAEVAAKFSTEGSTTTVAVAASYSAMDSKTLAGTLNTVYQGAKAVAKMEGSSAVTIQAVAVRNKELEARLIKQGFKRITLQVGDKTEEAFEKTFKIRKTAD